MTTSMRAEIVAPAVRVPASDEPARSLTQRVPFRGPPSPRGIEYAQLSGKLPAWLRGDLIRVAPWFDATPNWLASHWFDAAGIAFGFELNDEAHVKLRWSALDSAHRAAAVSGKIPMALFGTPNERSPLARLCGPIPRMTDNTNVNVVRIGEELIAMTETAHQLRLDPDTLVVRGPVRYEDRLTTHHALAHPQLHDEIVTGVVTKFGPRAEVTVYRHPSVSRRRKALACWKTAEWPYLHAFGLTEVTALIIDHPLRMRPWRLLWSNRGIGEHLRWQPGTPTRLIALDLVTGAVRVHETDPLFCLHTVHAFETREAIVFDLLAYEDASVLTQLDLQSLTSGKSVENPQLLRLSIDRVTGAVARHVLCDERFEVAQADWEYVRAHTREEQIVYGTEFWKDGKTMGNRILRVELAGGATRSFCQADHLIGEPVFVGTPDRSVEGDGVLLVVGSSERGSTLYVLDATTLAVRAHAAFSTSLPLGFHGSFTPRGALAG